MTDKEALMVAIEALYYCEALNRDVDKQKMQAIIVLSELWADYAVRETQRLGQEIEQEPVAKFLGECSEGSLVQLYDDVKKGTNFYTHPPQRKPLTHKEIWNAIRPLTQSDAVCMSLVQVSMDEYRAIEAAHGVKENT